MCYNSMEMKRIIRKFKKAKVSPVTGQVPTEGEEKWFETAQAVKGRLGMAPVDINFDLMDPDVIKPLVETAPKKQVPALLMKTVQDLDKDRLMGKRLAMNIVRKQRELATPPDPTFVTPSLPVETVTKKTPLRNLTQRINPFRSGGPSSSSATPQTPGTEIVEYRLYTPQELADLRRDYAQNGEKDAQYIARLWEKGADTVTLLEREMRKIKGIIENPSIYDALEHVLDAARGDTHSLLDWITAAWRLAFPTLDLTQFEAAATWNTYQDAIGILRKLGILWFIYNQVPTPLASPLQPEFKKIIVKGAPPHLKMSLVGSLQGCRTIDEAVQFFKGFRELEQDKVISFQINTRKPNRKGQNFYEQRQFRNITARNDNSGSYRSNWTPRNVIAQDDRNRNNTRFNRPRIPFLGKRGPRVPFNNNATHRQPQGQGERRFFTPKPGWIRNRQQPRCN